MLPVRLMLVMASVLLTSFARSAVFDAAVPIWTTAEKGEINSSVAFTSHFEWDGGAPIRLRLAGCSIFKVFVKENSACPQMHSSRFVVSMTS